jgi:hypothetical protein
LIERKCLMRDSQGRTGRRSVDQYTDLDLTRCDHLNIDASRRQNFEERGGDTGVGAHAEADDGDLGDFRVVSH